MLSYDASRRSLAGGHHVLQTPVLFATAPLRKLEAARERKSGMHLAIISDIHGECFALDWVLQDIRRQGVEQIVCLGDALQGGSQPAEIVARLRELNCPVVMGNADAWLITDQGEWLWYPSSHELRNETGASSVEDVRSRHPFALPTQLTILISATILLSS